MPRTPPDTGPHEIDAEERALFATAVKGARRLRSDTHLLQPTPPKAVPRARRDTAPMTALREPSDAELIVGDHLEYRRVGVQPAQWRRLKRGEYPIELTVDLHSLTVVEARALLAEFLAECTTAGHKCVRVVHGKGFRSPAHAPVLKPRVAYWLAHAAEVVAYTSARPADGGTGALIVLLKRRRE